MNADVLLYHLSQLGVVVDLSPDLVSLVLDAPAGVMTRELTDLLREHKDELVDLVYEAKEREAIEWEGCRDVHGRYIKSELAHSRTLQRDDDRDEYGREIVGSVPLWEPPHAANF